jgi:hypothetical protein
MPTVMWGYVVRLVRSTLRRHCGRSAVPCVRSLLPWALGPSQLPYLARTRTRTPTNRSSSYGCRQLCSSCAPPRCFYFMRMRPDAMPPMASLGRPSCACSSDVPDVFECRTGLFVFLYSDLGWVVDSVIIAVAAMSMMCIGSLYNCTLRFYTSSNQDMHSVSRRIPARRTAATERRRTHRACLRGCVNVRKPPVKPVLQPRQWFAAPSIILWQRATLDMQHTPYGMCNRMQRLQYAVQHAAVDRRHGDGQHLRRASASDRRRVPPRCRQGRPHAHRCTPEVRGAGVPTAHPEYAARTACTDTVCVRTGLHRTPRLARSTHRGRHAA